MTTITFDPQCHTGCNDASRDTVQKHSVLKKVTTYLQQRRQRKIDRDAFRHLLTLDQAMLDDIGVTKADIRWANSLPLSTNASLELQKLSLQNRGY